MSVSSDIPFNIVASSNFFASEEVITFIFIPLYLKILTSMNCMIEDFDTMLCIYFSIGLLVHYLFMFKIRLFLVHISSVFGPYEM